MRSFLLEYNLCGDRIPHLENANSIKINKDKLNFKYEALRHLYYPAPPEIFSLY